MGLVNLRRNILQIFVIVSLIVGSVGLAVVGTAPLTPVISVEPPTITAEVGGTFTINVTIADVTIANSLNGIYMWEFGMNFDPSVLNATSVMEGPFLKNAGYPTSWNMMPPQINNYEGTIAASNNLMFYPENSQGALGSGVLCNITFQVRDIGRTTLGFYKTKLETYVGGPILPVVHTKSPGFFTNVHDVAVVDVEPSTTSVVLNDSVSIDVTVANEGDFPETFDVTTHWIIGALRGVIGTKPVIDLGAGTNQTVAFTWDTTGLWTGTGTYTIKAVASVVEGEKEPFTDDNAYIDGEVNVTALGQPVADFTLSSQKPEVGETVTFNATASTDSDGSIVSWDWNFNDGNVGSGEVVTHAYTEVGTYKATLTVKDNDGIPNTVWKILKVVDYPVAAFTYSPEEPLKNRPVTFDASGSTPDGGTIISYTWDFGDGTNATGVIVDHSYANNGTYLVTLTVTDDEELTDSTTCNVTVSIKHDVAVLSVSIPREYKPVYAGFLTKIAIVVKNNGTEPESFNVTAYYDDNTIGTPLTVVNLPPLDQAPENEKERKVYWDTRDVPAGEYTITAIASIVEGETEPDTSNNKANVTIRVNVADVAIANVTASPTTVLAGNLLNVNVTVKNEGTVTPEIDPLVKIYFTNSTHSKMPIIDFAISGLENGTEKTESRSWDATEYRFYWKGNESRIFPGTYTLSVEVSPVKSGGKIVESEFDLEDNTYIYGSVTVGASLISVSANPADTTVGSRTTINGSIAPKRPDVNVTIQFRLSGNETWNTLETVTTDENSTYSYDWKPDKVGIYEIKASWEGDDDTLPSESEILTIKVEEAPSSIVYFLYAGAAVAVIVVAAIAIYFLRVRKSKPT